ncbi:MAG: hypothetical protein PUP93_09305 [Rhizonema sp. NSF051]|nr:hypothetical protein [Rhizonema sp. NSF051]
MEPRLWLTPKLPSLLAGRGWGASVAGGFPALRDWRGGAQCLQTLCLINRTCFHSKFQLNPAGVTAVSDFQDSELSTRNSLCVLLSEYFSQLRIPFTNNPPP